MLTGLARIDLFFAWFYHKAAKWLTKVTGRSSTQLAWIFFWMSAASLAVFYAHRTATAHGMGSKLWLGCLAVMWTYNYYQVYKSMKMLQDVLANARDTVPVEVLLTAPTRVMWAGLALILDVPLFLTCLFFDRDMSILGTIYLPLLSVSCYFILFGIGGGKSVLARAKEDVVATLKKLNWGAPVPQPVAVRA